MRTTDRLLCMLIMAGAALLLPSCDGIYDDPADMTPTSGNGTFSYVDATSYTTWVYIDLAAGTQTSLPYDNTTDIPSGWTFALHRYDCRTNGGGVVETAYVSLDDLTDDLAEGRYTLPDATEFVPDEDGEITTDMSHMMDGYLVTAPSRLNKVMGRWLNVDTSTMPPAYTMSGRVYLVAAADGTVGAVRFTAFSNPFDYDKKGYISFDYVYPLNNRQ